MGWFACGSAISAAFRSSWSALLLWYKFRLTAGLASNISVARHAIICMITQPVTVEVAPTERSLPGSRTQASPSTPQLSITRSTTSPSRLPLGCRESHLALCSELRTAIVRTERSFATMANSIGQALRPEFDATTNTSPPAHRILLKQFSRQHQDLSPPGWKWMRSHAT